MTVDKNDMDFSTTIDLPAESRKLEFHYTALSFVAPHKIKFKYMLENFDSTWVEAGDRRVAYYTNLGPGEYRFRVIAANSDGLWNELGAAVEFRKKPHFYETGWFAGTVVFLLLVLLYSFYRLRTYRIKMRNIELEGLVEERTERLQQAHQLIVELEKETTERQMAGGFAHEIRNALTGASMMLNKIIHFTPDGKSMGEANNNTLLELFKVLKEKLEKDSLQEIVPKVKTINTTEKQIDDLIGRAQASVKRSLAVTEQILTYAQVGQEKAGGEAVEIDELFEEIRTELHHSFQEHDVQFQVDGERGLRITGNRIHLYAIFDNLIRNARDAVIVRADRAERADCANLIQVTTSESQDNVIVEVSDNGVGIATEDLERIFQPFFTSNPDEGTGLGLGMVKKYVSMYNGEIEINSPQNGPTTAKVTFPKETAGAQSS